MFIVLYRPLPDDRETLGSMILMLYQETSFMKLLPLVMSMRYWTSTMAIKFMKFLPRLSQSQRPYSYNQLETISSPNVQPISPWQPPVSTTNLQLNQLLHKMIKLRVVDYYCANITNS